jgi:hypothetical protein
VLLNCKRARFISYFTWHVSSLLLISRLPLLKYIPGFRIQSIPGLY